jgi:hypothetical protein
MFAPSGQEFCGCAVGATPGHQIMADMFWARSKPMPDTLRKDPM